MRWSLEVTFEEVRAHLGFETQQQWNPPAILRSGNLGFVFIGRIAGRTLAQWTSYKEKAI